MEKRENLGSRIGFLLLSAGCAIGIGNVWRFPYVVGENGGGIFVLFYLLFLVIMGLPVLSMEFAIGRASKQSIARSYTVLEKPKQKWHYHGIVSMVGNYLLLMFYTTVCGWMMYYFIRFIKGDFVNQTSDQISNIFLEQTMASPISAILWMAISVIISIFVCSLGVKKGVEKITKWMMLALLALMVILAVYCLTLDGAVEGLKFYLFPNVERSMEVGIFNVMIQAMNQAFFTLSLGIGSMAIFGSYLKKDRSLLGEAATVVSLDTFVAVTAGLIIFPACFSFGVSPDSGPSLIFITLPNVFGAMAGGRILGTLFFVFMSFAALSTVIAVCENIIACCMDLFKWTRKKSSIINLVLLIALSIPCAIGFSTLANIQPLGPGSSILDLEDFIVSNILLPIGSLVILVFCTSKLGWGYDKYLEEANQGKGLQMKKWPRIYLTYVLPILILIIFLQGIISKFF